MFGKVCIRVCRMSVCAPTNDWHGISKEGAHKSEVHQSEQCHVEARHHCVCDTLTSCFENTLSIPIRFSHRGSLGAFCRHD